jgi:Pyruvate/2-oxoacid:ferredoxin oxidoreductase gamma subunit
MSIDEELQEHAEHAKEPFDKRVAASMALIAAALAIVTVLGHIRTTEELRMQQRAADEWAHHQAQRIRVYQARSTSDILRALHNSSADAYGKDRQHFEDDANKSQDHARDFERESDLAGKQALRLETGEVFLEVAIVFASLAILSRRARLWYGGILAGAAGAEIAITTLQNR